jgi:hypothetical protein
MFRDAACLPWQRTCEMQPAMINLQNAGENWRSDKAPQRGKP